MPKPTRLTPELQAQICGYVNGGAPLPVAVEVCGVPWRTCRDWNRKGREGKPPYDGFVAAVKVAKARWEAASVMRITKAGDKDWKAAAWLLERRRAKTYRAPPTRSQAEVAGPGGKAIETRVVLTLAESNRIARSDRAKGESK